MTRSHPSYSGGHRAVCSTPLMRDQKRRKRSSVSLLSLGPFGAMTCNAGANGMYDNKKAWLLLWPHRHVLWPAYDGQNTKREELCLVATEIVYDELSAWSTLLHLFHRRELVTRSSCFTGQNGARTIGITVCSDWLNMELLLSAVIVFCEHCPIMDESHNFNSQSKSRTDFVLRKQKNENLQVLFCHLTRNSYQYKACEPGF